MKVQNTKVLNMRRLEIGKVSSKDLLIELIKRNATFLLVAFVILESIAWLVTSTR
jgi:hypothetical protein